MKKLIVLWIIILTYIIFPICVKAEFEYNDNIQEIDFNNLIKVFKEIGIVKYNIEYEDLIKFLENPSDEKLVQYTINKKDVILAIERNVNLDNVSSPALAFSTAENKHFLSSSVYGRKDGFYLNTRVINDINSNEKIEKILSSQNVNVKVNDYCIIEVHNPAYNSLGEIPFILWVQTNKGNYYITMEVGNEDYEYNYIVYSGEEFYNTFKCINAELFINGERVTNENDIKIYNKYAQLPVRKVLEKLGVNVKWSDTERYIILKNDKFVFKLNNGKLSVKDDIHEERFFMPAYIYNLSDGKISMGSEMLSFLLDTMGFDFNIDVNRDKLQININAKYNKGLPDDRYWNPLY